MQTNLFKRVRQLLTGLTPKPAWQKDFAGQVDAIKQSRGMGLVYIPAGFPLTALQDIAEENGCTLRSSHGISGEYFMVPKQKQEKKALGASNVVPLYRQRDNQTEGAA